MKNSTFHLIDAINCEGLDNSVWGVCEDIESTKGYFGTIDDIQLKGKYIYLYINPEENYSFIKDAIELYEAIPYVRMRTIYEDVVVWKL